ncbi:MAG: AAA family ATPase [Candidatus Aramenus sp.]|nr:AAA family ATPase [Candidatus Aramenus sp.]
MEVKQEKLSFLVVIVLPVILAVVYKDPFFLLLSMISLILVLKRGLIDLGSLWFLGQSKPALAVKVDEGLVISGNEYIGVVEVHDVPVNYRDVSELSLKNLIVSFYKVVNVGKQVDIIFRKKHVDIGKYKEKLIHRAQNLRVIVESDPSNTRARSELDLVNNILERLNEGEIPFKYVIFILVRSSSKEEALQISKVIIRGLDGLGLKARLASRADILDLLFLKELKDGSTALSLQVPFLTPFSVEKLPELEVRSEGIYLGNDIERNMPVFWNIEKVENPQMLVIGPSGSGKTEFLISVGSKIALQEPIPVLFFDVKGDIKRRLRERKVPFKLLNPLLYSISMLELNSVHYTLRAIQLERIIANSFSLDRVYSSIIFHLLNSLFEEYASGKLQKLSWDLVEERAKNQFDEVTFLVLSKIIEIVKVADHEGPPLLNQISQGVNVIDLSLIKSEVLRRLIILSVLQDFYNKYSSIVDEGLRAVLVIDEAWTILRNEREEYPIVSDIVKRGRGFGISLLMATQNVEDLGDLVNVYLDNVGLLVVMNNGDKKFWNDTVKRFASITDQDVELRLSYMGKGEALVRFLGDPRPLIVKLHVLAAGPV